MVSNAPVGQYVVTCELFLVDSSCAKFSGSQYTSDMTTSGTKCRPRLLSDEDHAKHNTDRTSIEESRRSAMGYLPWTERNA